MWVRRCGIRAMWPSYIKVLATLASVYAAWFAVRGMMRNIQITDLNLTSPAGTISCLVGGNRWPRLGEGGLWSHEGGEFALWWQYDNDPEAVFGKVEQTSQECSTLSLPLDDLKELGVGFPDPAHGRPGKSRLYAAVVAYFLSLSLAAWVSVHDLSLIQYNCPDGTPRTAYNDQEQFQKALDEERDRISNNLRSILDVEDVKDTFPTCWSIWRRVVACSCGETCCPCPQDTRGKRRCILAYIYSIIAFVVFVCPFVVALGMYDYVRSSILRACKQPAPTRGRLSRLVIFCLCCMSAAMYLTISIYILVFANVHRHDEDVYAVVFHQGDTVCGCHYPMSKSKYITIAFTMIGNGLLFVGIGTKTLKGLRCSNWATLITCMFSVPMALYPVQWKYNNEFIQHRDREANFIQPVQAEPAFDPFALLDEQPNSHGTHLAIEPRAAGAPREGHARPNNPNIECCGFPWKAFARENGLNAGLLLA